MNECNHPLARIAESFGIFDDTLVVHDEKAFSMISRYRSLGLGESYMAGMWDCGNLDVFLCSVLSMKDELKVTWRQFISFAWSYVKDLCFNPQAGVRSFDVGKHHYDIGNPLFECMLDKRMIYSCAYWGDGAKNINEAQESKLRMICEKLKLKKGMEVLDIGCGWGGFATYASENYGVHVIGITISKQQFKYCKEHDKNGNTFVMCSYEDLDGKKCFDRIVSIGMFEHVGIKNYSKFMHMHKTMLKEGGLIMLHTIVGNKSKLSGDEWFTKYIFPNSMLPSMKQICEAAEGVLIIEDVQNIGAHYDKTLMSWYNNFHRRLGELNEIVTKDFIRMWDFYLLFSAALFRSRTIQLCQFVMSKGIKGGYERS